ncbi:hypothetical protein BOTBODRAFT_511013 [Botryobasidium botryosum FD-172 SS1]|uniref:Uncharacterized protein n=1 Tax=Botryobasidium botryosum (strain FD-172 SS1) TaxID=930990 RepID=A0A067MRM0_BOTB1|nr:hypothetical protein BOTBODRAFT_511013 [Botryobasidium botryosum FD-172 SS1]
MADTLPESIAQLTTPEPNAEIRAKAKPMRCPTYVPPASRCRLLFFGYNVPIKWIWAYAWKNVEPRPRGRGYNQVDRPPSWSMFGRMGRFPL